MPSPGHDAYTDMCRLGSRTSLSSPTNKDDVYIRACPRPVGAIHERDFQRLRFVSREVPHPAGGPPRWIMGEPWEERAKRRWEEYGSYPGGPPEEIVPRPQWHLLRCPIVSPLYRRPAVLALPPIPDDVPDGSYFCKKCSIYTDSLPAHFFFAGRTATGYRWLCKVNSLVNL
jgi:hypothetical protein